MEYMELINVKYVYTRVFVITFVEFLCARHFMYINLVFRITTELGTIHQLQCVDEN